MVQPIRSYVTFKVTELWRKRQKICLKTVVERKQYSCAMCGRMNNPKMVEGLIAWCSAVFHLYSSRHCTYPCFSG